jgi:alanyl-tRNA synthetase
VQVFDTGVMSNEGESLEVDVANVQVKNGYVCHIGTLNRGTLAVGDTVFLSIDGDVRGFFLYVAFAYSFVF